jgi:hypothetical protein
MRNEIKQDTGYLKIVGLTLGLALVLNAAVVFASPKVQEPNYQPGLAGSYFNNQNFTDADQSIDILKSLAQKWEKGRGNDWSGRWMGFIEGPATGDVEFYVEAVDRFQLKIDGEIVIDDLDGNGVHTGTAQLKKGEKTPIEVSFISQQGKARLFLFWSWDDQPRTIIPGNSLSHDASLLPENARLFDYDARWSEKDGPPPGAFPAEMPAFTGGKPPYADTRYHSGRLRPVVGVHNFQVLRANRTYPELMTDQVPSFPDAGIEKTGFTYNHAPMLSYWKDKFWLLYRSGPVHEHQEPCYALVTWSEDGRNWVKPHTVFPAQKFRNRKEGDAIQYSISHQRMGWYLSPEGRLIASGFYGLPGTPNDGQGAGRVVREVFGPGEFGPIYWVRYNPYQGYGPSESPHYPYYKSAPDQGFVKIIDGLLANKLMVQQWFEEDRDNSEGFFAYGSGNARYLKAFNWYTRPDGKIVGMWKWKKMAVADEWESGKISYQGTGREVYYGGAKIWGQRTSDGKYALAYNPVLDTTWRHPLSVTTGSDGKDFDSYFLNVHSETPLMRFGGANKDGGGAQYVRGIIPGNGTPPDGAMWLTYSSNKEDIFVTRVPVPIRGTVDVDISDDFEALEPGGLVTDWNIYTGIWNPVSVVEDGSNRILRLQDKDPWDYAKAVRVFPESTRTRISLDVRMERAGHDNLEIEVQNYSGQRPVRILLIGKDRVLVANEGSEMEDIGSLSQKSWIHLDIDVDTVAMSYSLFVDGEERVSEEAFAERLDQSGNPYGCQSPEPGCQIPTVERIVFRTGIYRDEDFSRYGFQANNYKMYEPDLPGPDEPVELCVYDIDNFKTKNLSKAGQ